jgi:phospholipid-binding lipoprotein MlaA
MLWVVGLLEGCSPSRQPLVRSPANATTHCPVSPCTQTRIRDPRDPLESLNRRSFALHRLCQRTILSPFIGTYRHLVPQFVKKRLHTFFDTLNQPLYAINALMQGQLMAFCQHVTRGTINGIMGCAGTFDVAKKFNVTPPAHSVESTLKVVFGWKKKGPYLVIPMIGPMTTRMAFGLALEAPMNPAAYVPYARAPLASTYYVMQQQQLNNAIKDMTSHSDDAYQTLKDIIWQLEPQTQNK